jgi:PemK-like, MazF-like toxin of type II toxin-antitoxin system
VSFPEPVPGLVIRYSYLWHSEHVRGRDEGSKDRPCVIVLATAAAGGEKIVVVLPITHTPPDDQQSAIEIPAAIKRRLLLDEAPSWVMLNEANRFAWPGPDLRPAKRGDASSVAIGPLPYRFFEDIRLKFISALERHSAKTVWRSV